MGHEHSHSIRLKSLNRAFIIGIVLNLAFVFVEFGAGLIFDSMALLSDAGHNLSDVVSLILALLAFRLAKIKPGPNYTYGYKKSTVLVSLLNAIILLIAVGIILAESIDKIKNPQPVPGGAIAWVAGIGVLINAFTALLFLKDKEKDLNVKGAYLHMAADALVSVGVLVAGIVIRLTGWFVIDPIIGIIVAIVILISTWGLLRDSLRLSLDGVPGTINRMKIEQLMKETPGVRNIHHLHLWAISTTENALTAHIVIDRFEKMAEIKQRLKHELEHEGIGHATLEFETVNDDCGDHCD